MSDDVVAELDAWLMRWDGTLGLPAPTIDVERVKRARDEIVALRQAMTHDSAAIATLCNHARRQALEEAAHECDEEAKFASEGFRDGCETCAAAIRALKDKG